MKRTDEKHPSPQPGARPEGASRRAFLGGMGAMAAAAGILPGMVRAESGTAQVGTVHSEIPGLRTVGREGRKVALTINSEQHEVKLRPRDTLLTVLREQLGLTGSKEVCGRGSCGGCTVLLDGTSVCGCMTFALDAVGRDVTTIEGIEGADEIGKRLVASMCEHDSAQCGFCIPGIAVRSRAVLEETPNLDGQSLRYGLSGNICRCGTYTKIFEGVLAAKGIDAMNPVPNNVALENEESRVDVHQKVTGAAKFTADLYPPNMIYARFIRFPYGGGRVETYDLEEALAVPGVLEVEIERDKARDAAYAGQPIGHIVAETQEAIEDGLAALALRARPGLPDTQIDQLYNGVPELSDEQNAKLAALYDKAAAVVEVEYRTQVQTHSCLETHGAVVDYKGDSADVWGSTQATFAFRDGLTGPLGLEASKVHMRCEYVGGGFGSKFGPDSQGTLVARISKKFERPCKYMLDRHEEHLDTGLRPGSLQYMKIAADKSGKLLGGRIHVASSVGHQPGGGGARNPLLYDFGEIERTEEELLLNSGLPRPFRAPGHPQGVFALESLIDEIAAKLGVDPLEVRLLNETSDRRRDQYRRGADLIGWSERHPDGSQKSRIRSGLGCAGSTWYTWPTQCEAMCEIYPTGKVEVHSGVQDIGTGTFTVVTDVAADQLGIGREWVTGLVGHSTYPPGPGSGGSVTARSVSPAVRDACEKAKAKVLKHVADEWGLGAENLTVSDGQVRQLGGSRSMSWKEACSLMTSDRVTGHGEIASKYLGEGSSDGVQFAEVEVDTETGIVRVKKIVCVQACGQIVNRHTTENQVYGGVIQGISYALFEDRILDRQTGAMVNPNLEFYKIAGPADIPEIVAVLDANESDTGVRSLGEPVTIPTSGAIANAVANALGVRVRELPITPDRVLAALETQGGQA